MGLLPGINHFKARLTKDGPWLAVKSEVIEDRDPDTRELMSDVIYRLTVNGDEISDYYDGRFAQGLIGEVISETDYRFLLADVAYAQLNMNVQPTRAVNLRELPPILPPGV